MTANSYRLFCLLITSASTIGSTILIEVLEEVVDPVLKGMNLPTIRGEHHPVANRPPRHFFCKFIIMVSTILAHYLKLIANCLLDTPGGATISHIALLAFGCYNQLRPGGCEIPTALRILLAPFIALEKFLSNFEITQKLS